MITENNRAPDITPQFGVDMTENCRSGSLNGSMRTQENIRSDLAEESGAPLKNVGGVTQGDGYRFEVSELSKDIRKSELLIQSEAGEKLFSRQAGRYITWSFPELWLQEDAVAQEITDGIGDSLWELITRLSPRCEKILVIGLGNRNITSDDVGPNTVSRLHVTRHVKSEQPDLFRQYYRLELSAFCPGVVGQTGIESGELVLGAVRHVSPDIVILVDALAARDSERLFRTVQLSDVGLTPGSGIGNRRMALNRTTLGVPTITVGVPTVVSSATLVCDALQKAGIDTLPDSLRRILHSGESFFVSLKEADQALDSVCRVLSDAMNHVFGSDAI